MSFYLVFGSVKRPQGFMGGTFLDWSAPPIGVYQGDSPEEACKAAASDHGAMGTFFAIEGTPWGLELITPEATQLGKSGSPLDRLTTAMENMNRVGEQIQQLTAAKQQQEENDGASE